MAQSPPQSPFRAQKRPWNTNGVFASPDPLNLAFEGPPKGSDPRLPLFQLQAISRELLYRPSTGEYKALGGCYRWLAHMWGGVQVMHHAGINRAYYQGLQHCGLGHVCPVCSWAIYRHREQEIQTILDGARAQGLHVTFITFTAKHRIDTPLKPLLSAMSRAMRRVFSGNAFVRFKEQVGYLGAVRAAEVTTGPNGWHPHFHALWLTTEPATDILRAMLPARWTAALGKEGLPVDDDVLKHGVMIKDSSMTAAEYMAKFEKDRTWDLDKELARGKSKRSPQGFSPWDLLRINSYSPDRGTRAWAATLYQEYADAIWGTHHIQFSRGIRERFNLTVVSDDDIAAGAADSETLRILARLTPADWKIVVGNDCRGELLQVANSGDFNTLAAWLLALGIVIERQEDDESPEKEEGTRETGAAANPEVCSGQPRLDRLARASDDADMPGLCPVQDCSPALVAPLQGLRRVGPLTADDGGFATALHGAQGGGAVARRRPGGAARRPGRRGAAAAATSIIGEPTGPPSSR